MFHAIGTPCMLRGKEGNDDHCDYNSPHPDANDTTDVFISSPFRLIILYLGPEIGFSLKSPFLTPLRMPCK